jgi:hypothetical protein
MTFWQIALPLLVLVLLLVGFAGVNRAIHARALRRHDGDARAAMADAGDAVPGTPDITDDDTPLGDTPEAHDEISPHDLPRDHPGRAAAELLARGAGATTRGLDR